MKRQPEQRGESLSRIWRTADEKRISWRLKKNENRRLRQKKRGAIRATKGKSKKKEQKTRKVGRQRKTKKRELRVKPKEGEELLESFFFSIFAANFHRNSIVRFLF